MRRLSRKFATVRSVLADGGLSGVLGVVHLRIANARARGRRWVMKDRAWVGRLLSLTGHTVWIDGCRFNLRHPLVTDALRCRVLLGRYERSERELLGRYLDPHLPVVEFGGGLGVIACLANRRLANRSHHVVVEANPALIPVIERHRHWNDCDFRVVHGAVDYSGGTLTKLQVEDDFISARVGASEGTIVVPVVTLSDLLDRFSFRVCTVVCDIEGAETALVDFEGDVLARHTAYLIVEIHPDLRSNAERAVMVSRLHAYGFEEIAAVRKVRVFENRQLCQTHRL